MPNAIFRPLIICSFVELGFRVKSGRIIALTLLALSGAVAAKQLLAVETFSPTALKTVSDWIRQHTEDR